ncbi:MAG TPA: hypothetical protein VII55_02955 [Candidatus Saccharimonadales bacterium]
MRHPDLQSLVLVGPPRGGKDTLIGNIAEEFSDEVIVPERWSTRPYHASPGKIPEWTHASPEDFEEGVATGMISPHWSRSLDIGGRPVRYSFLSVRPGDDRLRAYSANYPILEKLDAERRLLLARAMVITVTADPEILHDRLEAIGHEMPHEEKMARHRKIDQNAPQSYRPGLTIDTSHLEPHEGQELFRNLVKDILLGWTPAGYSAGDVTELESGLTQPHSRRTEGDDTRRGMSRRPLGT